MSKALAKTEMERSRKSSGEMSKISLAGVQDLSRTELNILLEREALLTYF